MLNELIGSRFYGKCPVCGRIFFSYYGPFVGWCPYCSVNTTAAEEYNNSNRLTSRDENDVPIYIGHLSWHNPEYASHLSSAAVEEILKKLCKCEEKLEILENEKEEDG